MTTGEHGGAADAVASPGVAGGRGPAALRAGSSVEAVTPAGTPGTPGVAVGQPAESAGQVDRDRIVAATMDVVSTVGFAQATVEDIVATAGVGRRKFWRHFSDKNAALIAGYEQITDALRQAVQEAHDAEPDPARRVTACLAAMADFLAADPVRADVFLIQGPAAGREVIEIRTETMRRLGGLLAATVAELAPCPADTPDRSAIVIESLAGGLYEIAYTRAFRGEVHTLPALVPDLTRLVLGPYRPSSPAG